MTDPGTSPLSIVSQAISDPANDLAAWPWPERELLGLGGYGVVYRLGRLAVKVGRVEADEAAAQRHFARVGLALPVLFYQAEADLPAEVGREVCPRHGLRREFLPAGQLCSCGQPMGVLLMPIATPLPATAADALPVRAFMAGLARDCERELGRFWDTRPANVAYYRDRLIALDFGEPSSS